MSDPLYPDKQIKKVLYNSKVLRYHVDNMKALDNNLNTYRTELKSINAPFVPPYGKDSEIFVTITNVVKDKRYKNIHSFEQVNTEEYR